MNDIGQRLKAALTGRYTVEREVGAGGMALVYLADDIRHHRKVAVKVLRPDLAAAIGGSRFLREIEIAAQLTHPHILPLYDSGEADPGGLRTRDNHRGAPPDQRASAATHWSRTPDHRPVYRRDRRS